MAIRVVSFKSISEKKVHVDNTNLPVTGLLLLEFQMLFKKLKLPCFFCQIHGTKDMMRAVAMPQ